MTATPVVKDSKVHGDPFCQTVILRWKYTTLEPRLADDQGSELRSHTQASPVTVLHQLLRRGATVEIHSRNLPWPSVAGSRADTSGDVQALSIVKTGQYLSVNYLDSIIKLNKREST